jgi:pyruvate dehydrogenase E2 component (dihydrolipoamide acetyltransferase)
MSVSVTMPRLGESVSEGTVTRWLKQEGDHVDADEPLLEVSTDKVDTEIPSPSSGVLKSIKVGEDETVEVGAELAVIDDGAGGGDSSGEEEPAGSAADSDDAERAEEPQDVAQESPAEPEPERETDSGTDRGTADDAHADGEPETAGAADREPETDGEAGGESSAAADERESVAADAAEERPQPSDDVSGDDEGGSGPSYVTPLVRRLASEHGVDLADVQGTGVGGRIRKQDVLDAAEKSGGKKASAAPEQRPQEAAPSAPQQRPAPTPSRPAAQQAPTGTGQRGKTEKLSRLRSVIAQRMVESLQVSAQLTTVVEADLTRIARLRDRAKADFESREGVKLSFLPFFALATCEALREHPAVNASIDVEAGTATYHDAVHLGIAVDTPRGLLVPVVRDASDLNLAGLARKVADLAERTRSNQVTPDELGGGTFTLTNTGSRGALFDTPIINQPQVGILGTGAVVRRPVVDEGPDGGEVIAIRHMVYLALTYDHRMVDGADAARFLTAVKERLETGDFEAELGL